MEIILFQTIILLSLGILFIPSKVRFYYLLLLQGLIIIITSRWAFEVFSSGQVSEKVLTFPFLGEYPRLVIDQLSAFFILAVNFTSLTSLLFSREYLKFYTKSKKDISFAWHYFNFFWLFISMLLVCMVRQGLLFLVVWEIMSVTSFMLVIFESEARGVLSTGIRYLIQMHIGILLLIAGFLFVHMKTGQPLGFESFAAYFNSYPVLPLFLVFFVGFGIKAGFIPLHTWLPSAHPAAPSHVSGLMSGIMIKMGIYGILRTLSYIHSDLLTIGIFVTIVSIISGLLGVIYAIVQHDIKKLLAYHSIENIGIIGIGIGLGVIGIATNNQFLASVAFTGGILHVLNHSLFKSLLFYSAGSVYQKTHTRYIEQLGGVIKKMPFTGMLFLLAALAICGLPPFNGFVSEFLIYFGSFNSMQGSNFTFDFLFLGVILSLALIGGLAIFCFVKVFSVVFLGTPRKQSMDDVKEASLSTLIPEFLIGLLIIAIGIVPFVFVPFALKAANVFGPFDNFPSSVFSSLGQTGLLGVIFVVIILIVFMIKKKVQKNTKVSWGATWGCAYQGADPTRHQYTATSFADNHLELLKPVFSTKKHFLPFEKKEIFPAPRAFSSHAEDLIEEKLLTVPYKFITKLFSNRHHYLQTGQLHHYILYAIYFVGIILILTILNII